MSPAQRWRGLALAGYFGLLGWILLWNTVIAPPDRKWLALLLAVLTLPLLAGLRGMLHARHYTHAWVGMLSLLYFVLGVGDAYADPVDRPYGLVMIVLSLMLFAGTIGYIKTQGKD